MMMMMDLGNRLSWLLLLMMNRVTIGFLSSSNFLVLPATTTDRDVAESATFGPVPTTSLAKVARLREAVVVVVTKFGMS